MARSLKATVRSSLKIMEELAGDVSDRAPRRGQNSPGAKPPGAKPREASGRGVRCLFSFFLEPPEKIGRSLFRGPRQNCGALLLASLQKLQNQRRSVFLWPVWACRLKRRFRSQTGSCGCASSADPPVAQVLEFCLWFSLREIGMRVMKSSHVNRPGGCL